MSLLLPIRKYLTVDQLIVYCEVYEQTVQQQNRIADAVTALQKSDPRREHSAVKKVIDALNTKFENVYELGLLVHNDDGSWKATVIGDELYNFARAVRSRYADLDRDLKYHTPDEEVISFYIRQSLSAENAHIRKFGAAAGITGATDTTPLVSEHYSNPLKTDKAHFVVDELFLSDKRDMDKNQFKYFQLEQKFIHVVASPKHPDIAKCMLSETTSDDSDESTSSDETIDQFLLIDDLKSLHISIPKKAVSVRIAASVAAARIGTDDYLSGDNFSELRRAYPNMDVVDSSIEDLALSLSGREQYALFLPNHDADRLDEITGIQHERYRLRGSRKSTGYFYYNPAVITTIERAGYPDTSEIGKWVRVFEEVNKENTPSVKWISNAQIDYDKPSFVCANCGHRISYSPETIVDREVTRPCAKCVSVVRFDREADTSIIIKTHKDIEYTDEIYEEVFHCPTDTCDAVFKPRMMHTTRYHDFVFCDSCNTIFQSGKAKQQRVKKTCPTSECNVTHEFWVSEAKPMNVLSCYNSLKKIIYDLHTDVVTVGDALNIKEATIEKLEDFPEIKCPHFGCGDIRQRRLFLVSGKIAYTRCRNCKNDIRVKIAK